MVTALCNAACVRGTGLQENMTDHGLRGTMISQLIAAVNSDSSIILRKGHSSVDKLTRFHNLQCMEGFKQQVSIFNSNFTNLPFHDTDRKPFCNAVASENANQSTDNCVVSWAQPSSYYRKTYADNHSNSELLQSDVSRSDPRSRNSIDFCTSVGTVSTERGQINVTINNNYHNTCYKF